MRLSRFAFSFSIALAAGPCICLAQSADETVSPPAATAPAEAQAPDAQAALAIAEKYVTSQLGGETESTFGECWSYDHLFDEMFGEGMGEVSAEEKVKMQADWTKTVAMMLAIPEVEAMLRQTECRDMKVAEISPAGRVRIEYTLVQKPGTPEEESSQHAVDLVQTEAGPRIANLITNGQSSMVTTRQQFEQMRQVKPDITPPQYVSLIREQIEQVMTDARQPANEATPPATNPAPVAS